MRKLNERIVDAHVLMYTYAKYTQLFLAIFMGTLATSYTGTSFDTVSTFIVNFYFIPFALRPRLIFHVITRRACNFELLALKFGEVI